MPESDDKVSFEDSDAGAAEVEPWNTGTEAVTQKEIERIQAEVCGTYGVKYDDVTLVVGYETSGSLSLDIMDDVLTDGHLEKAIESEIAVLLKISRGNIDVTIEDGVARYTITSDNVESAINMQGLIREVFFIDAITKVIPADVVSVEVDDRIDYEIVVDVNTTNAENDLELAARSFEKTFEEQGFTSEIDSNIKFCLLYSFESRRDSSSE